MLIGNGISHLNTHGLQIAQRIEERRSIMVFVIAWCP